MAETLLKEAKLVLRISDECIDFDEEISSLINACLLDLGIAGVENRELDDPLIERAVMTFVKMNFGEIKTDVYNRLKTSYDEQKAQLSMSLDHRSTDDGQV